MRLIDADALIEDLKGSIFYSDAIPFVEDAPTAYDVDKVVEEIKISSGNGYRDVDGDYVPPMIKTKNAIDIVRKGGIDG